MSEELKELPLLSLKDPEVVIFPGYFCEVHVGRSFSINAVAAARAADNRIIVAMQKSKDIDEPQASDFFDICCEAEIKSVISEDNKLKVILQGTRRGILKTVGNPATIQSVSYYYGKVEIKAESEFDITESIVDSVRELREMVSENLPRIAIDEDIPESFDELSMYVDNISAQLPISGRGRMKLLRMRDTRKRLTAVLQIVAKLCKHEGFSISTSPPSSADSEEGNASVSEMQRLKKLIEDAKLEGEVLKVVKQEFRRLQMIPTHSAEFQVSFNYIETLASLPWNNSTEDKIDIKEARKVLNGDHFGMSLVKDRILEFLAVKKLVPEKKGSILCFAGFPGVGKTSSGKSIAKAMGREFVRMSLGGVNDEAEIRGHRRTYVGAMPGKVIQMIRKVGFNNPVFMLDEVDKLCSNYRGDPASSLLEVLDPEQNYSFLDNYLGIPFDLSSVMFIATVNDISAVPHALRDRMEVIDIPGYSIFDKVKIAQNHLVPRKKEDNGLKNYKVAVSDKALFRVVEEYTNEAGVRNLERYCGTLMRKMAVKVAAGDNLPNLIEEDKIPDLLGPPKVYAEKALEYPEVGVSTGLAWSPAGGSLLFVECSLTPGKGEIELTGNLGKVIKESAKAALTWIKSHAAEFDLDVEDISKKNIHLHFPAGATPKDGPSAGIALSAAMLSAFLDKPVRNDVAMTGEISLRGRVMPIGGLREKILAAHRAGILNILYPAQNEHDLEDIPEEVKKELTLTPISVLSDALSMLILDEGAESGEGGVSVGNTEPLANCAI